MEHSGSLQVAGVESGQPWVDTVCQFLEEDIALFVNGTEVLRRRRGETQIVEKGSGIYELVGGDEPLFFLPQNKAAFDADVRGEALSTAARVAAAAAVPPATSPTRPSTGPLLTDEKPRRPGCLWLFLAVVVLAVIGANMGGGGGGSSNTPAPADQSSAHEPVEAYVVCQQFVEDRLRSPSTAEFGGPYSQVTTHNGGGEYTVRTYVDAQNAFGAMIRNNFTCVVQHTSGDSYSLESLDMTEN